MNIPFDPVRKTRLDFLMEKTRGNSEIIIGLIDGPMYIKHVAFKDSNIATVKNSQYTTCESASSIACIHGTFIAGMLSASRKSSALAICPGCKLLLYPIFRQQDNINKISNDMSKNDKSFTDSLLTPSTTPKELSNAIIETIDAGAKIINISAGLPASSIDIDKDLEEAYDYALNNGVIIVAAAGNQGNIGHRSIINHPWVIPVAACDEQGSLASMSNFGPSIGNRGLMAPGVNIRSTSPAGGFTHASGTSFAAPFVTAAIALMWSLFPKAMPHTIKHSILNITTNRRRIIPPLLDAKKSFEIFNSTNFATTDSELQ